jgi:hypothetical protein
MKCMGAATTVVHLFTNVFSDLSPASINANKISKKLLRNEE